MRVLGLALVLAAVPTVALAQDTDTYSQRVDHGISGAFFYKVSSAARTRYKGIAGSGVLPHVSFDPRRFHNPAAGEDESYRGPMDIPSIYMGGNAGTELDCGLSWSRVLSDGHLAWTDSPDYSDGRSAAHRLELWRGSDTLEAKTAEGEVFTVWQAGDTRTPVTSLDALSSTKVDLLDHKGEVARAGVELHPDFAWRPFWRTMTFSGGKIVNSWHNAAHGSADDIYLYPGEPFSMSLEVVGPEQMRLEVAHGTDPQIALDVTFEQANFGMGKAQSFKRVNSIDQFMEDPATGKRHGNEDKQVIKTASRALGGRWDRCVILESNGSELAVSGPAFTEVRGGEFDSHRVRKHVRRHHHWTTVWTRAKDAGWEAIFHRTGFTPEGGETIDIEPPAPAEATASGDAAGASAGFVGALGAGR